MAEIGTAVVSIDADTTALRGKLEELQEMGSDLSEMRIGRIGFSLGDAGVVASVLGFIGYLVHVVWG